MKSSNCECLPGWEQYQSKEEQQKQAVESLGLYDPTKFDPSGQEATLYSRVQSKMSDQEVYEHGLSPVPVGAIMPFPVLGKSKKRK